MKVDFKRILFITILLLITLFFAIFIQSTWNKLIVSILLLVFACATYYFIKKRDILSIYKKQVTLLVAVIALLCVMAYYLSGIKFGIYKSIYSFTFLSFIKTILPSIVIIISIEIIRSVLLAQNSKLINVLSFIICIISEVLLFNELLVIDSLNGFMDLVGLIFFPAVLNNLLYHYLSKRYGVYPNISYRLIVTLHKYIIPYESGVADSLMAFIKLFIPVLIYGFINALFEKKSHSESHKSKQTIYAIYSMIAVLMISIAMLISCQFKYGLIVVATDSMNGEINKGDVVLYDRYEDQIVTEGQVIVFEVDNTLIIHRVVEVESINNQIRYYTKGDANDDRDSGYITNSNIKGLVDMKIAYIGYPTIWIKDIFES